METDTLMRLAAHKNVVGVKEASGDLGQIMDVLSRRPKGFSVLSGDDNLLYPLLALGGDGVISVAAHLVPEALVELTAEALAGRFGRAREIHYRLMPLFKALFIDTNPIRSRPPWRSKAGCSRHSGSLCGRWTKPSAKR